MGTVAKGLGRTAIALVAVSVLTACSGSGRKDAPLDNYPPDEIFKRGEYELAQDKPEDAARYFSEVCLQQAV